MSAKDTVETVRTSWGSDNDGSGTGMDSDLLDGKSSEVFLERQDESNCNLMTNPGFYSGPSLVNQPNGAVSTGAVTVTTGLTSTATSQIYVDANNKMFNRFGSGTPVVWGTWYQLGIMNFDGVRLRITL